MSKNFQIRNCPLCNAMMKMMFKPEHSTYYCPYVGNDLISHYEVTFTNDTRCATQKIILDNFFIVNEAGSGASKIYTFKTSACSTAMCDTNNFLMEIPMIVPEHPDKMLKKIKLLIPFI